MVRPMLCTLAAALTGAASHGDHTGLVQQSLQRVDLPEEPEEGGVLGVLGSVVNMMKLDNLLREKILSFESEAEAEDSPTPKLHTQEAPTKPPAEALTAQVQEAPAEPPVQAPKAAIGGTSAGTGCSLDDHSRISTSIASLGKLLLQKGPKMLQHALPKTCGTIFGIGVNFTAFDGCVQELFEVHPSCSMCQVNLIKSLVGTNLFHLGCTPKCGGILARCKSQNLQNPSKDCLGAVADCMDCGLPSWKEHSNCVGGLPNRHLGPQVLQGLITALRSSSDTEPESLKTILQRAAARGIA